MAYQLLSNDTVHNLEVMRGAGPVTVGKVQLLNATAAVTHLQLFDAAATASVTLGTTVPTLVVVAATSSVGDCDPTEPLAFINGIVAACTTTSTGSTTATGHVRLWIE